MTLFQAFGQFAGQAAVAAGAPGMVLMTPTSVSGSGVSLSGSQVVFTAATSISIDGVFTADFDNYVVAVQADASLDGTNVLMRLRASGSDNSTASSYVYQRLSASSTTVGASRNTSDKWEVIRESGTGGNGSWISLYGPFLAQPTAMRDVHVSSRSGAWFIDSAGTHNQSTSYDGITLFLASGNMTGALQVYGVRS